SHELRTPLNSLLILSNMLAENPAGNLDEKQIEFARTIHTAGTDLLELINDILDLSKVEAGKMELNLSAVALADVAEDLERSFRPVAEERALAFRVEIADDLPAAIVSDEQRLQQVLRNLLSNALKFTHEGSVTLRVTGKGVDQLAFQVVDTGVGIPADKLQSIFEAFQQADGTTSRKYGGTGLGLSISREITRLLGGELQVASKVGEGSTFTLMLPLTAAQQAAVPDLPQEVVEPTAVLPFDAAADDRAAIAPGDRVLLVIAHDARVADGALAIAREHGYRGLVARRTPLGLALARDFRPDGILVFAGDGRGERLLGQLKRHPETRHRPVIVVGPPAGRLPALRAGAAAYLVDAGSGGEAMRQAIELWPRFTAGHRRRLAVVAPGGGLDQATEALLGAGDDVELVHLAPDELADARADCAVLVAEPGGTWALDLVRDAAGDDVLGTLPMVLHAATPLPARERRALEEAGEHVVLRSTGSPERLVDEVALFLHRPEAQLPTPTRKLLAQLRTADAVFQGKRVLIVDDDIRNVFALASALEVRGMKVAFAENGREGIEKLRETPDVDLVLLDVMMPEMDGYETARAIRSMPRFEALPIIQLTAKAMKGDRDKSIAAGASDYITKPVDVDQLLSLMRVWLHA
ncbi:MAG TPA: ATP-binding protein, partial [Baekduia sp.]|nr:ATP-binding protein [Baekduia sp.]